MYCQEDWRKNLHYPTLCVVSTDEPTWLQEVILIYEHDPATLQLITELITTPHNQS